MADFDVSTDEFVQAMVAASAAARRTALANGHSVVFVDATGRYLEERPDGRLFEVRLDPTKPRHLHRVVLREGDSKRGVKCLLLS